MKIHQLKIRQKLPVSLEEAWDFFSTPKNLDLITPDYLSFKMDLGHDDQMYAGQVITYRIRPFLNIPRTWVTEITHCVPKKYFVDEQRFGPYKFWHHQHHFQTTGDGIIMRDTLHYALPYGWIGELMGILGIHRQVKRIFKYREQKLEQIFSKKAKSIPIA